MKNKRKIMISGNCGMMPSAMTDFFIKNNSDEYDVYGADDFSGSYRENLNPECNFTEMDLRNGPNVREYFNKNFSDGIDTLVVGTACAHEIRSYFSPLYNASINDDCAKNCITYAIEHGVRHILYFSSMARYGNGIVMDGNSSVLMRQPLPFRESFVPAPCDPYACSKVYIETFLKALQKVHNFTYTIIVPHNCFSPRQYVDVYRNVIAIWMNLILMDKDCYIYGSGLNERAISWVDDFNPPICQSIFKPAAWNQTINVGGDIHKTLNEWYDLVCKVSDCTKKAIHIKVRPGEVDKAYCNHSKAQLLLGFENKVPVEDALREMWQYFKQKGPREFKYINEFEINSDKIPETWKNRLF
jgi:UDP-glucose 4-epimerase